MVVFGTQSVILGWQRGDTSHLLEAADRLLEEFPDLSAWPAAVALVRAIGGRPEEARALLQNSVANLGALDFSAIWTAALLAFTEVARIVHEPDAAAPIYEMLAPYGDTMCVVSLTLSEMGPVHRPLGVLATLMGDFAKAEAHFEGALAVSTEIGAPPHIARTSVDYARMLLTRRADGDAARARTFLADSATTAEGLGMSGLLADISDLEQQLIAR